MYNLIFNINGKETIFGIMASSYADANNQAKQIASSLDLPSHKLTIEKLK
jgi:hypothetical protein